MDKYLDVVSSRMAQERKRLGLEQTEVCKFVDISIPTLSRYENGKRSPDLVLAKRLCDLGYDMHYVLTGERLGASVSDMTDDERDLVGLYRQADNPKLLLRLVRAFIAAE